MSEINLVKESLSKEFKMQDFGEASAILGIKITRDLSKGTLTLSQSKYARNLLKRFGMEKCGGSQVPLSSTASYGKEQCPETDEDKKMMENVPYRQAIGSLMYLMVSTRPDLAYAIQILSRFGANPGPVHWKGVK